MEATGFDVVLVAEPPRRAEAGEAIALARGRLVATLGWDEAARLTTASLGRPVLVLEAEGVAEERLLEGLPHVRALAEMLDLPIVATHARSQIDVVGGALIDAHATLLCEVGFGEWVGAIALAGRRVDEMMVADRFREGEGERLHRLNEEVARIAELLARLAGRERGGDGAEEDADGVGDRHIAFGFEPPAETADPRMVRQAIRARRMRDSFLGEGLFEDPAWDMLLDLYAAQLEGGRVSVSSLCIAAAVAPTTALRWIGRMTDNGLFVRQPDPADRRRAFMVLSSRALKGMNGYVAAMRRAGLPIG